MTTIQIQHSGGLPSPPSNPNIKDSVNANQTSPPNITSAERMEDDEIIVITGDLTVESAILGWKTIVGALAVVVIFLLTGTLFFGLMEDWSALDALYFSTSTITTCGLGDFIPQHPASKIFMIFYIIAAIGLIGSALGLLAQAALLRHEKLREEALRQQYHGPACHLDNSASGSSCCERMLHYWDRLSPIAQRSIVAAIVLFLILVSSAIFFTLNEGWTVLDSLYYAAVVSSTVGLGDLVSDSTGGKIFSIFLMLFGSAVVATSLTSIADVFIRKTQQSMAERILAANVLPESLSAMDFDKSGDVSEQEFLEFMLVHMGLVAAEDIRNIKERFHTLDRDHNGTLEIADLTVPSSLSRAMSRNDVEELLGSSSSRVNNFQ